MLKPEDAEPPSTHSREAGMEPEKPPEEWLSRRGTAPLVDLIFGPGLEMADEVIERGDVLSVLAWTCA